MLVAAVIVARAFVADGDTQEAGAMPLPVILLAAFTAAAHARTVPLAVAGLIATFGGAGAVGPPHLLGGHGRAERRRDHRLLHARRVGRRASSSGGAPKYESERAVLEERARIARELHDIIGHSVSVISLQAGAAEQLIRKDPDKATATSRPSARPPTRRSSRCAG